MSFDRAYMEYYLQGLEATKDYASRTQQLYDGYRQQLDEAAAPARERLQRIAQSWAETMRDVGNGDDSYQRAQAAWLDHQRQYIEAVGGFQSHAGEASRKLRDELMTAQQEAEKQARQRLAAYLGKLQELLVNKQEAS